MIRPMTVCMVILLRAFSASADTPVIHSVTDIAHEFSFYMDARFTSQYTSSIGGVDARNWGTLHKLDLTDANLLILASGATPCPYFEADIAHVRKFLEDGGGVVVMGSYATFRGEKQYQLNSLAKAFGAYFSPTPAKLPLKAESALGATEELEYYGGKIIRLQNPAQWTVLVRDAKNRVLMARRSVGKGSLLIASRGLAGQRPDASDPINQQWWTPLLASLSSGKTVDPNRQPEGQWAENVVRHGDLQLEFNDYMAPYADIIFEQYDRAVPLLNKIMGVPPSKGMLSNLLLLPTGGGGFSSGDRIGLGVWWGDFPEKLYGMIELIGHEAAHSWVLPFPEPMWNEPIATYVGIYLAKELGQNADADATLARCIANGKKLDPDMTKFDIAYGKDVPNDVYWGKCMWIFEELRKQKPDILAAYFQAKRKYVDPAKTSTYTPDDTVAMLSIAMGSDLFTWFKSLGLSVDRNNTSYPVP